MKRTKLEDTEPTFKYNLNFFESQVVTEPKAKPRGANFNLK